MKSRIFVKIIIVLNSFFIIFALTLGILSLSIRQQLLNPDYYKTALSNSGIYNSIQIITTDYTQHALIVGGENVTELLVTSFLTEDTVVNRVLSNVITQTSNSIIQERSRSVAESITDRLEVSNRVQQRAEQYINNHIQWLTSDTYEPPYFRYIPDKKQLDEAGENGVLNLIIVQVIRGVTGINNLPVCATPSDESNALMLITQRKSEQILCTSRNIDPFINSDLMKYVPSGIVDQLIATLQSNVADIGTLVPQSVIDSVTTIVTALSEYKELMYQIKYFFEVFYIVGLSMLILAGFLLILNIILIRKGKKINYVFMMTSLTGLLIVLILLANKEIINQPIISNLINQNINIENGIISGSTSLIFNQSLNNLVKSLLLNISGNAYQIGVYMLAIGTFGYLGKEVYDVQYGRKVNKSL